MLEVEAVRRLIRRQKRIGVFLGGHIDRLVGMREREPVEVHHERSEHRGVFSHRICHKRQVKRLLVVFRIRLDPPMVEQRQRIALIAVDVPRERRCAVRVHHHDGKTPARGVGEHLGHVEKALTRSRRKRARARGRCAHRAGKGRMLGFHMHVFRLERAFFHHLGKSFDHDGLRSDGVSGNHLRFSETNAFGEGLVT